jgi:Transposase and inactivated derivatives
MHRYELTDEEWGLIEHLFPGRRERRGRRPRPPREVLNALFWLLRSGSPWRDLPERYGPWQTIYHHFSTWRKNGVFDRMLEALHIRLDQCGHIDWDLWCVDGSSVRAARAAAGAGKGAPTNPPTTLWAARAADSAASSTWLLTATGIPSRSTSRRGRSTSRRSSRRS